MEHVKLRGPRFSGVPLALKNTGSALKVLTWLWYLKGEYGVVSREDILTFFAVLGKPEVVKGTTVLKVKNTIVNIWQGIIKSHISRFNLPFSFNVNSDSKEGNASFLTADASDDASIGFKWYTSTDIFTVTYNDSYDALSQSCQSCKTTSVVAKQKTPKEVLTNISYDSLTVSSSIFDCENDGSGEYIKLAHELYSGNVVSVFGVIISSGHYLDDFLSKQAIIGSCGYSVIIVPTDAREQSKICINLNHKGKNEEDVCNDKSKMFDRSFMTSFGRLPFSDQDCYFDNKLTLNRAFEAMGKDLEDSKDQCDLDKEEKEWESHTPRTLAFFPKASPYSNRNVKKEVQFVQVSEIMVAALHEVCAKLKDSLLQYSSANNISQITLLDVIKSKLSVVYDAENNSYSLSIDSPPTNLALNSIPSGINPDLISFVKRLINQYVMTSDSKIY